MLLNDAIMKFDTAPFVDRRAVRHTVHTVQPINQSPLTFDILLTCLCSAFEFYNNVLRAKGNKVPFGTRYPGLQGEITTGKFVTTIVSIHASIADRH